MPGAPLPENEAARLRALHRYGVLDSEPEPRFDAIAELAAHVFHAPIALVSLVDEKRQWFKAAHGLDVRETPRHQSFCAHSLLDPSRPLVVPDATCDARFAGNPLVTAEPYIRFYAGAPLVTSDGFALGTLCVIDRKPRRVAAKEIAALERLARVTVDALELRLAAEQVRTANEKLVRANEELEHFSHGVAHDLSGPLGSISGLLQLVLEDEHADLDARTRQNIGAAVSEAKRLASFVRDLLRFAELGRPGPPRRVGLEGMVREVIASMTAADPDAAGRFEVEALPDVEAPPEALRSVLENLIGNALKYGGDQPQGAVRGRRDGGWLVVEVADRGPGIAAADRERIFEPFVRIRSRTAKPGSGIGLANVKRVVESWNGRVWVESAPGQGSAFHFRVPLASADDSE